MPCLHQAPREELPEVPKADDADLQPLLLGQDVLGLVLEVERHGGIQRSHAALHIPARPLLPPPGRPGLQHVLADVLYGLVLA